MPFFKNGTYRDRYLRGSAFPAADTLRDFVEVVRAVSEVHRLGLAVRDIKPQNILVSDDGAPIISDFGLSMWTDTADEDRHTASGEMVGSQGYRPPEWQMRYPAPNHKPGDIWSLGRTLWAMITGRYPPNSYDTLGGAGSHVNLYIDRSYANLVQSIITGCTHQDPSARPTIDELEENACSVYRVVSEGAAGGATPKMDLAAVMKRFNVQVMNSEIYLDASRQQSALNIQITELIECRDRLVSSLTGYAEKLSSELPKDLGVMRVVAIFNGTAFLNLQGIEIPLSPNESRGKVISLRFDPSDQIQVHKGLQYCQLSFYIGVGPDSSFYWILQSYDQTDQKSNLVEQITTKSLAILVDSKLHQLDQLVQDRFLPMIERHFTQ
jgi:serine/threonine protein kinase